MSHWPRVLYSVFVLGEGIQFRVLLVYVFCFIFEVLNFKHFQRGFADFFLIDWRRRKYDPSAGLVCPDLTLTQTPTLATSALRSLPIRFAHLIRICSPPPPTMDKRRNVMSRALSFAIAAAFALLAVNIVDAASVIEERGESQQPISPLKNRSQHANDRPRSFDRSSFRHVLVGHCRKSMDLLMWLFSIKRSIRTDRSSWCSVICFVSQRKRQILCRVLPSIRIVFLLFFECRCIVGRTIAGETYSWKGG